MLRSLQDNIYLISFSLLGLIIGLFLYFQSPRFDVWRVEYEYNMSFESRLPSYLISDTVFLADSVVVRNYTASISDSVADQNIKRNEIRMIVPYPSTYPKVFLIANDILAGSPCRIFSNKYISTQRNKLHVLAFVFLGFFLGWIFDMIRKRMRAKSD